jgi:hypothetical protein
MNSRITKTANSKPANNEGRLYVERMASQNPTANTNDVVDSLVLYRKPTSDKVLKSLLDSVLEHGSPPGDNTINKI